MLADIMIGRAYQGRKTSRGDLHRHATFSCSMRRLFRRLTGWMRFA